MSGMEIAGVVLGGVGLGAILVDVTQTYGTIHFAINDYRGRRQSIDRLRDMIKQMHNLLRHAHNLIRRYAELSSQIWSPDESELSLAIERGMWRIVYDNLKKALKAANKHFEKVHLTGVRAQILNLHTGTLGEISDEISSAYSDLLGCTFNLRQECREMDKLIGNPTFKKERTELDTRVINILNMSFMDEPSTKIMWKKASRQIREFPDSFGLQEDDVEERDKPWVAAPKHIVGKVKRGVVKSFQAGWNLPETIRRMPADHKAKRAHDRLLLEKAPMPIRQMGMVELVVCYENGMYQEYWGANSVFEVKERLKQMGYRFGEREPSLESNFSDLSDSDPLTLVQLLELRA